MFFLNKVKIDQLISSYDHIENYSVFKRYPSSLIVQLTETNYLAHVNQNGKNFYLGSNGKLIKAENNNKKLPNIFGDLDLIEFFKLKKIIDESNYNFDEIESLFFFPSKRWDIEMASGVVIKLPKKRLKESFNLDIEIINDKNFKNIKVIDVRQEKQIVINE